MRSKKKQPMTELELDIMGIVWKRGEATVNDVSEALAEAGRPLAPPSIRTMLTILHDKGYVARRPEGRGHVYSPAVSADEGRRRILKDIIQRAFEGSASGLVTTLVKGNLVSARELDQVKRLIEKKERGAKS
jgi:predicted transcriptional regulator